MKKFFAALQYILTIATTCLCLSTPVFAQGNLGGLTGTVSDASGASVPGVSIKVINTATSKVSEAFSSDSGSYSVQALIPGSYRIEAEKAGFRKTIVENVTVQTATVGTMDVKPSSGMWSKRLLCNRATSNCKLPTPRSARQ